MSQAVQIFLVSKYISRIIDVRQRNRQVRYLALSVDIVTIFPDFFGDPLKYGVLHRAIEKELLQVVTHDLRDYTDDNYRTVDGYPFGGGVGMVMKPEPIFDCIDSIEERNGYGHKIYFTPQGNRLTQKRVEEIAKMDRLILICGRYKGVDERVRTGLIDEELSIGDFVLSGGEIAALTLVDAIARLQPGALGDEDSAATDSFSTGLLDHPHYTRPREYRGMTVPDVLFSGNHKAVEEWYREMALKRTLERRPELVIENNRDEGK